MKIKELAIALALLATQSTGLAQALEKKGLPCVAEICLGDGIAELARVQWAPARNDYTINDKAQLAADRKMSDDDQRSLKPTFPVAGDAAPYLYARRFDAAALTPLSRVEAACQINELIGNYGTGGSAPTRVGISLLPSQADPSKQVWTVTTIVREFPSAISNDERALITVLLKRRYGKFSAGMAKPGEGRFFPSGMSRFGFGLSLIRGSDEGDRMQISPACGGASATTAS